MDFRNGQKNCVCALVANFGLGFCYDGKITCAFIGSSGHGKTTIMDEMFPTLSQRKWLVTDVTDTTAQSLRISYAPPQ
ncbi:hypothetical protein PN36_15060 [Candidatus Thiomargarita nelsonii]|uniref:Uncharacterized protein n=1 Tax=Candidatus Thiomargarita nelsonii TaxID=1003181 RepID=A0A4E0R3G5_9GAMM|nr:hypothetical protein PN36_15060 [Candidatus Thiomargarita nelsonii]